MSPIDDAPRAVPDLSDSARGVQGAGAETSRPQPWQSHELPLAVVGALKPLPQFAAHFVALHSTLRPLPDVVV